MICDDPITNIKMTLKKLLAVTLTNRNHANFRYENELVMIETYRY